MLVGNFRRVNRRTGHAFLVFTFVVIGKFVYKEVLNRKTQQVKKAVNWQYFYYSFYWRIDQIFNTVLIEKPFK